MSDAQVYIAAATAARAACIAFIAAFRAVSITASFLATFGFWGWRDSASHNGRGRLALDRGQNVSDRLRGWRSGNARLNRQGRDLHGNLTRQKNHNPILKVLLHKCNEENVKHFVMNWLLSVFNLLGIKVWTVTIGEKT